MSEYKLVPVEPTEEMLQAACDCQEVDPAEENKFHEPYELYKAMLASCPDVSQTELAINDAVNLGTGYMKDGKRISPYDVIRDVSSEPVAWMYKDDSYFDGDKWHDDFKATIDYQAANFKDKNCVPLYTHPAPVASEPIGYVPEFTKILTPFTEIYFEKLAHLDCIPVYTEPQPDRVAELEAKLKVAREALQDVVDSGLLNGSYTLHDETSNKVHEALKQIGAE